MNVTRTFAVGLLSTLAGMVGCAGLTSSLPDQLMPPRAWTPVNNNSIQPVSAQKPAPTPKVEAQPSTAVEQTPEQKLPQPQAVGEADTKIGETPPPPRELAPIEGAPVSLGGPLRLEEVLEAVERNYPLLRSIEQERAIAGGRLLTSMGAFDLNLTAGVDGQGETYDNLRTIWGVSQALPFAGLGAFAGYRTGFGTFPTYNLGQKTAEGGEFRAGLTAPLLRDRAIDSTRANIRQAQIDRQIAEPVIGKQRLDFRRAAARTYWNWVAAGQKLAIAQSVVELAVDRDEQLKKRVAAGPAANIERIDNQQNIALRNGVLVQAQRSFQQATIDLSLFLRDSTGHPLLAAAERLPNFPAVEPIDTKTFDAALQYALSNRPELRRLRLQQEKAATDLQLASNQALPSLNAVVSASQDVGYGKSTLSGPNGLDRTYIGAGVALQLPVQQSNARGKIMVAQAQLSQIAAQLRNTEDIIRADIQEAFSSLQAAYEFYQQAKMRLELAQLVARSEREQLRLGRSDVLRVTLREQAAFDAELIAITAQQEYFRELADLDAAMATGLK